MKIGFIGIGNMASAIIEGMPNKKDIIIASRSSVEAKAKALGVAFTHSNIECALQSDILFLCVKPQQFQDVLDEIKSSINNKTLVSIAAKLKLNDIQAMSGINEVVRVMPNLNVAIKKGTSAYCATPSVSQKVETVILDIFEKIGTVEILDESLFSAFIGIAGSAPAFIFEFMDAMIQEVMVEGMDETQALRLLTSTMEGSAHYLNDSSIDAQTLIDRVCSPGGTTIEGINSLKEDNFSNSVRKAVRRTIDKDKA